MSDAIRAVVLLSGGLDSTTALAWAVREQGWQCTTLAFDYGQRHRIELAASARVAAWMNVQEHRVMQVDMGAIGGSALTSSLDVPKDHAHDAGIPVTYVPARNLVFLSLAAGLAESIHATQIVIGVNIVDYSGYPDCRPDFMQAFEHTLKLGTKSGVEGHALHVSTPLIQMKKSEIIAMGLRLGVDYSQTHSCYDPTPDGHPCGHCDSCHFRIQGFHELGMSDPILKSRS